MKPNRNFSVYCTVKPNKAKTGAFGKVWAITFGKVLIKWDNRKVPIWTPKAQVEVIGYF